MSSAGESIVLIGPMGSGKSTVGRALAALLGKEFIDSDHELEKRCGADIPWIFDIEGEEGFRQRETAVIGSLVGHQNAVIATGGGAVLKPENRKLLKATGQVIYLTAPLDVLFARVAKDKGRPLLQVENPRQAYETIFQQRDPLYRETADIVYESKTNVSPQQVARQLKSCLEQI